VRTKVDGMTRDELKAAVAELRTNEPKACEADGAPEVSYRRPFAVSASCRPN
jgi:hypothetical protein